MIFLHNTRLLSAAFFSLACAFASASEQQIVGSARDGTTVTRTEVLGAMRQALRDDAQPFDNSDQQRLLIDSLTDFKTMPSRAQKSFQFAETDKAYIARQTGEATMRAVAQLLDWRYRDAYKPDSPRVLTRAKELYAITAKEQTSPPTFEISHVVVRTDTRSIIEATNRASLVYERLKSGVPFEDVAVEFSDDPSVKSNKGHLPPLTAEQVDNAFARNTMREELVGKLLQPFLARSGIHIALVKKYNSPKQLEFTQVKDAFVTKAIDELVTSERVRAWSAIRIDQSEREYNLDALESLIKPPPSAADQEKLRLESVRIKAEMQSKAKDAKSKITP
jgi:PPIC-type PPIASE domain